jgi:hypothetical protein
MLQLLRPLAFLPIIVVAKIRRDERRLVEWFRARGALDAERAVTLKATDGIAGWLHRRLQNAGVIRAAGARYYFDESSYAIFRARRRRRATVVLASVLVAIAIGVFAGVIKP